MRISGECELVFKPVELAFCCVALLEDVVIPFFKCDFTGLADGVPKGLGVFEVHVRSTKRERWSQPTPRSFCLRLSSRRGNR